MMEGADTLEGGWKGTMNTVYRPCARRKSAQLSKWVCGPVKIEISTSVFTGLTLRFVGCDGGNDITCTGLPQWLSGKESTPNVETQV